MLTSHPHLPPPPTMEPQNYRHCRGLACFPPMNLVRLPLGSDCSELDGTEGGSMVDTSSSTCTYMLSQSHYHNPNPVATSAVVAKHQAGVERAGHAIQSKRRRRRKNPREKKRKEKPLTSHTIRKCPGAVFVLSIVVADGNGASRRNPRHRNVLCEESEASFLVNLFFTSESR